MAVDFSDASRNALVAAAGLARDIEASLVMMHVLPSRPGRQAKADTEASRKASEWAQLARGHGIDVEVLVEDHEASAPALVKAAEERGCAMLVIGTQGHSKLRRFLVGSVAREVMHRADIPVLAVPPRFVPADGKTKGKARNVTAQAPARMVLVCTDLTPTSDGAFDAGVAIASRLDARVLLMHSVDVPFSTPDLPYSEAMVSPEALGKDAKEAERKLAALCKKAAKHKVEADAQVHIGNPVWATLTLARSDGASLIVVGTDVRGPLKQFVLGSVAHKVVEMADRPVLVVPKKADVRPGKWLVH